MMDWTAASVAAALSRPGKGKSRKKGNSWMACCPAHTDDKPSLHLTDGRKRLLWHCHAGCDQDAVREALKAFLGGMSVEKRDTSRKPVRETIYNAHRPTLEEIGQIDATDFHSDRLGSPSNIWTYRGVDGEALMYVARYETPEGKEILPWSWQCVNGAQRARFMSKAWSEERPLYNLDKLAANPDAPVLYVEGEKAVAPAETLFPSFVVTTHQGGGKALGKADFSPLAGRLVVVQPDADEPGQQMAAQLALMLAGSARRVLRLDWPTQWPDGFPYEIRKGDDCFDHVAAGWTRDMIVQMRAAGSIQLVQSDVCAPFGNGEPDQSWGRVTMLRDGGVRLEKAGKVLASASSSAWRVVVDDLEQDFNRRLALQGCRPGRFPRVDSSAEIAPFMIGEIYWLFEQLQAREDLDEVIGRHLRTSVYSRGIAWRDRIRNEKREMAA